MLRKLRLTVAFTCLLATACFVVLWMRSFSHFDCSLYIQSTVGWFGIGSNDGRLVLGFENNDELRYRDEYGGFHWVSQQAPKKSIAPLFPVPRITSRNYYHDIFFSFWLLILISGAAATFLVFRRLFRFNLRSLAIATTLLVLALGLGVAASRLTLG